MSLIGPAVVSGIVIAGLYGLLATGIVIIFNTSGVINFAQGAIAIVSIFVLKTLLDHGVHPYLLAMVLAVAVGAALGWLVDRLTLAPVRGASALNKAIITIGWLILLQALAALLFDAGQSTNIPPLTSESQLFAIGGLGVSQQDTVTVIAAAAIGAGLTWFFRRTYSGVAMRAAAQNVSATRLMGVSVNRVSGLAWAIGGALAAVGGILVTPRLGAIDASTLTLYVIQSFAAALIGGLRNLPRTALGALALGLIQSLIGIIPGVNSIPGIKFSTAFVFIVAALLLRPDLAKTSAAAVSEKAVHIVKGRGWTYTRWALYGAIGLFFLLVGLSSSHTGWFGDTNRFHWAEVFADAVIFLSLVVLTGFVGQISLCQATFAGFGGFLSAIFVTSWGIPFLFAIPLAAVCTAPIGAVIGIPALRVRGLQLAVVTLSFAVVGDQLFFAQSFPLSGGPAGRQINGVLGGVDVTGDLTYRQLYWIFLGTLVGISALVGALKRSPSGRAFFAVRDSEDAATASGVSLTRVKLGAFALSAFIAALGGGMFALTVQTVSGTSFNPGVSIQYLALVILAGIRSVWGAFVASLFLIWGPTVIAAVLGHFGLDTGQADNWQQLLSGALLILTVILNPRGIVGSIEEIPSQLSGTMKRLRSARSRRPRQPTPKPVEA